MSLFKHGKPHNRVARAREALFKHTPGGVEHDQSLHGEWAEGMLTDEPTATNQALSDEDLAGMSVTDEQPFDSPILQLPEGTSLAPSFGIGNEVLVMQVPVAGRPTTHIKIPQSYHPLHFIHADGMDAGLGDVIRSFPLGQPVELGGMVYERWIDPNGDENFSVNLPDSMEILDTLVYSSEEDSGYDGGVWDSSSAFKGQLSGTWEDTTVVSEMTQRLGSHVPHMVEAPKRSDAVFEPPNMDSLTTKFQTLNSNKSAQHLELFQEANAALFGGSGKERGYTEGMRIRTASGQQHVATIMEELSVQGGGSVEAEWADFDQRLTDHAQGFLDENWTSITGVDSDKGFDPAGNPTWRGWFIPDQIEGQLSLETSGIPQSEATSAEDLLDLQLVPGTRGFSTAGLSDPDDWSDLHRFIEQGGMEDTLESAGFNVERPPERMQFGQPIGRSVEGLGDFIIEDFQMSINEELGYIGQQSTASGTLLPIELAHIAASGEGIMSGGIYSDLVSTFREHWASSSSHPISVAVQHSINQQFGLGADMDHMMNEAHNDGIELYEMFPNTFDSYVKAMYANSQRHFRDMGITHIPITRGMALEPEDLIPELDRVENGGLVRLPDMRMIEEDLDGITDTGEIVGPSLDRRWRSTPVDLQPVSSFSTDIPTAAQFANGNHAQRFSSNARRVMLRAMVPVERIIGHSLDGFGALSENEVLVLGGNDLDFDVFHWDVGQFAEQGYGSFSSIDTVWQQDQSIEEWRSSNRERDRLSGS